MRNLIVATAASDENVRGESNTDEIPRCARNDREPQVVQQRAGPVKFDLGKIGRVYLIGLFFGLTVLLLVGIGRMALVEYEAPDVFVPWWGYAFWLTVTLVHGLGAWGTLRRKRWAYYLSLVVSMYWIFSSARFLLIGGVNERLVVQVYPWAYALCLVLGAVAFAWLISPRARSELFSVNQKA